MPNMNTNPSVEQLENTISAYINSVYKDVPPTEEEFKEKADLMRASMAAIMPVRTSPMPPQAIPGLPVELM